MTKENKQQIVINHKVEQVVRAIYFGFEKDNPSVLSTGVNYGAALSYFDPMDYVFIGIADAYGIRFKPESNSALIALGYHPSAVLFALTRMRLNGEAVVQRVGDDLVAIHAAVAQLARDVVFNWEVPDCTSSRVTKGTQFKKPMLDSYKTVLRLNKGGKPPLFA